MSNLGGEDERMSGKISTRSFLGTLLRTKKSVVLKREPTFSLYSLLSSPARITTHSGRKRVCHYQNSSTLSCRYALQAPLPLEKCGKSPASSSFFIRIGDQSLVSIWRPLSLHLTTLAECFLLLACISAANKRLWIFIRNC